jgi:DNA-binding transcriptional MocR family regulator
LYLDQADQSQRQQWLSELTADYTTLQQEGLNLDLTRGKPSSEQLALSDALDGLLQGNFIASDGTDTRNYGGIDGLPEGKQLGADILGVDADSVLVGGNASLTLMFHAVMVGLQYGFDGDGNAWNQQGNTKFLCPVPGYDRHFTVCEKFGIEMVTVPMTATGPDMDAVENAVQQDPNIKGIWCVPKYSNPIGVTYSDDTVARMAKLANLAGAGFRIFWDNAYAVHDLVSQPKPLADIAALCRLYNTEDSVIQFASTSKITHAGAGVSFLSASSKNLQAIKSFLSAVTIGPDKVNQLRHRRLLPDRAAVEQHMQKHAAIIKPRFDVVLQCLEEAFGDSDLGRWERPEGGYFISFDARPGCAKEIIRLAAEAGVKLTPAGATFPYRNDPEDKNIRIAPTVPSIEQLEKAMEVFVICVKLASVKQAM